MKSTVGAPSSSGMLTVCWLMAPTVALVGVPMVTTTVSVGSMMVSGVMVTVMSALAEPAGITRGLAEIV